MAQNPNPSTLDPGQIVKRAFDESADRLRVDAEVTATIVGPQEVIISDADDSIKIGDGSGHYVTVTNNKLDVNTTISGVATEATLSTLNGKVTTVDTGHVTISTALPAGANTIGKVDQGVGGASAWKVDGSAVTQPVSGTITANAGSGTFTVSGTVTANAGTNLNTSALALESGGNLASIKSDVDNLNLAQGSTTSGQKGNLILSATTTSTPTYSTGTSNPLSTTTTGALRTDSSATTQPVSGTITANQGGAPWSQNITQVGGVNVSTGTGASGTGIPRVTVANDSNILATQSGTWNINNISGTVSLPTGAATSANQTNGNQKAQILNQTTTFSGSGSTLNSTPLPATDVTGYTAAYVVINATPSNGAATTVTASFQCSNDNSNWLDVPAALYATDTLSELPNAHSLSSFYLVQAGVVNSTNTLYKVSIRGKYLRLILDFYSGSGTTIAANAYCITNDSSDFTLVESLLTDQLGNQMVFGQNNMAGSIPVAIASDQSAIPVSGTVTANQGGTWNINNISGTVSLPTGASTAANQTTGNTSLSSIDSKTPALGQAAMASSSPVVIASNQSAIPVSQSGTWNINNISGTISLPTNAATSTKQSDGTQKTQIVDGSGNVISSTSNALNVSAVQSGTWNVNNISGTVSLPTGAATENTLAKLAQAQSSTTSTQSGPLIQGAVTTSAPSYSNNQTNPISLTTTGNLRVDGSSVTQPISAASLPLPTGASTDATVSNTQGSVTSGTAATKSNLIGAVFNTTLPTPNITQQTALQTDQFARLLISNPNMDMQTALLQELILEVRAMRFALVTLVTEGTRCSPEDFDPNNQNFESINILN